MAVTGALTLVAAVAAALFARAAAKHAGEQVKEAAAQTAEAHRQVELSERQEALAQRTLLAQAETAQRQNEASLRVERRSLEARLDERIPFIIATARLLFHNLYSKLPEDERWRVVTDSEHFNRSEAPLFRQELALRFDNVSSMPALIDIVDPAHGEISGLPQGTPIIIGPNSTKTFQWNRLVPGSELANDEPAEQPAIWWFNLHFWVRDLAMLVRDDYRFSASLSHFETDGSQLRAAPMPPDAWPNDGVSAGLQPERHYERLDLPESPAE